MLKLNICLGILNKLNNLLKSKSIFKQNLSYFGFVHNLNVRVGVINLNFLCSKLFNYLLNILTKLYRFVTAGLINMTIIDSCNRVIFIRICQSF